MGHVGPDVEGAHGVFETLGGGWVPVCGGGGGGDGWGRGFGGEVRGREGGRGSRFRVVVVSSRTSR